MNQDQYILSPEVRDAITTKKPILALESTVITHGMPFPENVQTALILEQVALDLGVIPATICVKDGKPRIGLTHDELTELGDSRGAVKLSMRDLPYAMLFRQTGGTTVSATMYLANLAGIKVFSTGGIGGVHRGSETTMDISSDLTALSSIPVLVVCAGAKLILDLPKTLEYLETLAVPVYGYQTDCFPAFYSRTTPYPIDRIDTAKQAAEAYQYQRSLHLAQGMLVANPIPHESEIPFDKISKVVDAALLDAEKLHIKGKATTPYLLQRLYELTEGESLKANIELIKNNVRLGALIAKEM
ncbi:MAG TPA: pseudouridine-5'-phosphate glycosidase [Candidatus Cloacimonadota bacterium]|nr:pseudouridine-5'-phosphate glycosidase [Candidatus Cloacimonadota bacterium]